MVRTRPTPIVDPMAFAPGSAPAVLEGETTTPNLPQKARTIADISTNDFAVPVKNTFIDFGGGVQFTDPGTLTAPGKFVGRLAGMTYSAGNTAPNTPAGAGRACNPTISMVGAALMPSLPSTPAGYGNTLMPSTPAGYGSTPAGYSGNSRLLVADAISVQAAPGPLPPPMHTPHLPQDMTGFPGFSQKSPLAPPMQSPHVRPFQVSLCSAISPPSAMSNAAIPMTAPQVQVFPGMMAAPTMAPQMVPAMMPQMAAPTMAASAMQSGGLIQVSSMAQDGSQFQNMPRFAPPSYAMGGYTMQTPSGGAGPPPPSFAPSCATPAGTMVNRFFASSTAAVAVPAFAPGSSTQRWADVPPTPSAWPATPF